MGRKIVNVYFIGAGPGDPELITVKGKQIISQAECIIYAGSLVNPDILKYASPEAVIHNSASMHLENIIETMVDAVKEGKTVARLHTGDPSLYGAIREQMRELDTYGIRYEVVPGVSSFSAAAAALNAEYTLPGQSQTLILTRRKGRTPVPDSESLRALAVHNSSLAIFLSVGVIEDVVHELLESYTPQTPAAVVQKASWPEQKIVTGTLETIAGDVRAAGIVKTALILVGEFLGDDFIASKLYDKTFSHEYRNGTK
jgi:precorrin-4/cobalt-precorrin-4 C11-methyltransferase